MAQSRSRDRLPGHHEIDGKMVRASLTIDPLVSCWTINDFECDIVDVAGISASKSSALEFADVEAFGRYFLDFNGAPHTTEGLAKMLAHSEVRVVRDGRSDWFALDLWDGRLFLCNDGGSHHFAGAAVIARVTGLPVQLKRPLHVTRLNGRAWLDLIDRFAVLTVVDNRRCWSCLDVAAVVGSSFWIRLPASVGQGADLFLVPRDAPARDDVVELLCAAGARKAEDGIRRLLDAQRDVEATISTHLRVRAVG
jgi:hypothetical protein